MSLLASWAKLKSATQRTRAASSGCHARAGLGINADRTASVTDCFRCSHSILMLAGPARPSRLGWRIHARCLGRVVDNTRSTAKCCHQAELSLETLAWTPQHASFRLTGTKDVHVLRKSLRQSDFRVAAGREARDGVGPTNILRTVL